MTRNIGALVVAAVLVVSALACERRESGTPGDRDTLAIEMPDNIDESIERGARRIGGRVGEALEETGQAIERAGERLREEAEKPIQADDTL